MPFTWTSRFFINVSDQFEIQKLWVNDRKATKNVQLGVAGSVDHFNKWRQDIRVKSESR